MTDPHGAAGATTTGPLVITGLEGLQARVGQGVG